MNEPNDQPRDPPLSALYNQAPGQEPPAALDDAILSAARRAAAPRPRPWWHRLQVPVALAATVMLAVMLSLTMERNPPHEANVPPNPPPPTAAPVAGPVAPAEVPATAANRAAPAPKAVSEMEAPRQAIRKDQAPPPPAGADAAGAAAPALPAPAPPAYNSAVPSPAPARSVESATGEQRTLAAPPTSPAAAVADQAAAKREKVAPDPSAWIEEIRILRRQGAIEEAERRLREFRTAFPHYPLPDDLR